VSLRYTFHPEKTIPSAVKPPENRDYPKAIQEQYNSLSKNSLTTGWENISRWFCDKLRKILEQTPVNLQGIEEIRIRIGKPLLLRGNRHEVFIDSNGKSVPAKLAYLVEREDLLQTLERMTQSSLYAAEEEMKQGFLTLPGGHRVGITGEALMKNGELQTLKHISGLNVRITREVHGMAAAVLPMLLKSDGTLYHTLILSPPRAGKTTLLRELIQKLSDGNPDLNLRGQTVGVVDERGELAGMWQGVPAYNLGCRTDVLDGCPKRLGISMLVRAMSPSVIAVDELGHPEDVDAVLDALRTGVSVLSTAHAANLEEAVKRPSLEDLFKYGVFERVVILSRRQGPGTVEAIHDLRNSQDLPIVLN
jgi:stage III sporulation protein AA